MGNNPFVIDTGSGASSVSRLRCDGIVIDIFDDKPVSVPETHPSADGGRLYRVKLLRACRDEGREA